MFTVLDFVVVVMFTVLDFCDGCDFESLVEIRV